MNKMAINLSSKLFYWIKKFTKKWEIIKFYKYIQSNENKFK